VSNALTVYRITVIDASIGAHMNTDDTVTDAYACMQYFSVVMKKHKTISKSANIQRGFFTLVTGSAALHFTVTDKQLAAMRIRILPMNRQVWWPITLGMKGSN
jgi:hypothetical protein